MASSQSHDADVIAGFINLGDVSGLKRFAGRDFDWNACLTFGGARMLPLVAAISANIADPSYSGNAIQVIQWMMEAGASPRHRAPHTVKDSWSMWKEDDTEKTKLSVNLAGHSALSYAFKWLDEMRKRKGGADWSSSIKFLEVVVRTLASESCTTPKVGVHHSVCELWESIRELTSTHNVILETSDGEVSAHDHVLMVASPVLKAMLGSSMQEGASRRIPIRDSPSASVSLFLDILYAGSTYSDPDYKTMLVALDLAHRWQVPGVVEMLSAPLREMITDESFVAIAEASLLKGLEPLQRACAAFGAKNAKIQAMLKARTLPTAVSRLLGSREPDETEQKKAKKRRTF